MYDKRKVKIEKKKCKDIQRLKLKKKQRKKNCESEEIKYVSYSTEIFATNQKNLCDFLFHCSMKRGQLQYEKMSRVNPLKHEFQFH